MEHFKQLNIAFLAYRKWLKQETVCLRTTIKSKKVHRRRKKFQSDYRGGKAAPDKAHKLFGAVL